MDNPSRDSPLPAIIEKNLRKARRARFWIKLLIFYSLASGLPISFYSITKTNMYSEAGVVAFGLIASIVLALFLSSMDHEVSKTLRRGFSAQGTTVLSSDVFRELYYEVEMLRQRFNIKEGALTPVIVKTDYGVSPSVVSKNKSDHRLLIPLGFLRLYRERHNAALAILSHEMSHIVAGDANDWLVVNAYSNAIKNFLIPFQAVAAFVLPPLGILFSKSFDVHAIEEPEIAGAIFVAAFGASIIVFLFAVGISLLFRFLVGYFRKKSEFYADLYGARIAGAEHMSEALEYFKTIGNESDMFGQPTITNRLRYLKKRSPLVAL